MQSPIFRTVPLLKCQFLKICAILCCSLVLVGQASEAPLLRPSQLTLLGTLCELRYDQTARGDVESFTLLSAGGESGEGLLINKGETAYGSATIGERSFRFVISSTETNITEVAALPRTCEAPEDTLHSDEPAIAPSAKQMQAYALTPVTIDLIAFYTPSAKANGGGETAVRATIDLAVADLNQILANNELPVTVRLVQTMEIAYTESQTLLGDLSRFATEGDGYMDSVQVMKRRYKADIASLFVWSPDKASGQAYLGKGTSVNTYSVTQIQWAVGILAHEIGHNLGCSHDRAASSGTPAASYAYGYKFTAQGQSFRTVMAYPPGMRVPYFSTPNKYHLGVPVGTATENNARIIAERAAFISGIETVPPPAPEPPRIVTQPASQWVKASETVTFSVMATGAPTLRYQWMKNGTEMENATSPKYIIMRATESAAGVYSVRVSNNDGTVVSSDATLNVETPVVAVPAARIIEQPRGLIVRRGEDFLLTARVTPESGVNCQWFRNGMAIEGANQPTLLMANASRDHSGQYKVYVSNETGAEESAQATVVTLEPSINCTPRQQDFSEVVQIVNLGRGGAGIIFNQPSPGTCEVQYSTDLINWNSLGEVAGSTGLNTFIDLQPYVAGHRYYRVRSAH